MTAPLDYAPRPARRAARWWLWALTALVLLGGVFFFFVPYQFAGRTNVARAAAARTDVEQLRTALEAFKIDTGRYPAASEGLGALVNPPPGLNNWRGPYVRRLPRDPWARPYVYAAPAAPAAPRVVSSGPDGTNGTADDIAAASPGTKR